MQTQPSVFNLLAAHVQKALAELGFSEPRCRRPWHFLLCLNGENVLLVAPTGSGKTEAVLLPVFSKLIEEPNPGQKGIRVLYITPLRALNRDMLKRMTMWAQKLGLTVEVRHGDTEQKTRRLQAKKPPTMLVTTPETLQAVLPGAQMRQHLRNVEFVIVDEVHDLASSKRGAQLSVALERLRIGYRQGFPENRVVGNRREPTGNRQVHRWNPPKNHHHPSVA